MLATTRRRKRRFTIIPPLGITVPGDGPERCRAQPEMFRRRSLLAKLLHPTPSQAGGVPDADDYHGREEFVRPDWPLRRFPRLVSIEGSSSGRLFGSHR